MAPVCLILSLVTPQKSELWQTRDLTKKSKREPNGHHITIDIVRVSLVFFKEPVVWFVGSCAVTSISLASRSGQIKYINPPLHHDERAFMLFTWSLSSIRDTQPATSLAWVTDRSTRVFQGKSIIFVVILTITINYVDGYERNIHLLPYSNRMYWTEKEHIQYFHSNLVNFINLLLAV